MKSSTARSLQVFCMLILCQVALHVVTGNNIVASSTDMGADTGSKDAALLPAAREGTYSSMRKFIHEIPNKENTPVRRKRAAGSNQTVRPKINGYKPSVATIVCLIFLIIFLALALVYFYKVLNRESDGAYTLTKLCLQARGLAQTTAAALQSRLGGLSSTRAGEDEERGKQDEEEEDGERESLMGAKSLAEDEQQEEDSSDDYSSMGGFRPQRASDKERKGKRASQEKKEEKKAEVAEAIDEKKEEKEEEGEEKTQSGQEGAGLLADLKEFSGSAIWAEEDKSDGDKGSCDVTEL